MKRKDKLTLKEMLVISKTENWSKSIKLSWQKGFSLGSANYCVEIGKTSKKKDSRLFINIASEQVGMLKYYYHLPDLGNYTGRDSELLTEYQRVLNLIEERRKGISSEALRNTRKNLNLLKGSEGKRFSLAEMLHVAEKLKFKDWLWDRQKTKEDNKTVWKDKFSYVIKNPLYDPFDVGYMGFLEVHYADSKENLGTINITSSTKSSVLDREKNIHGSYTGKNPRVLNLVGKLTGHFQKEQKRIYYESLKATREWIRETEG
jgi:hypothetical protein